MNRFRSLAILAVAAALPLASSSLSAQNAAQFASGTTSLTLDSNLVTALTGYGVTVTPAFPATLTSGTATLPIVSGGADLDTIIGVIYHSGGLTFTGGDIVVTVSQFAIVNEGSGSQPQIYGLVIVNGTTAGLFPLFNIGGPVSLPYTAPNVTIPNLTVTLSSQGATLLNQAFGFSGFSSGQVIGTATVSGTVGGYTSSLRKK